MGEGWSDTLANWLARTSATNRDFFLAAYTNGGKGLRHYPYSTSKEVNPLKYSDLPKLTLPSGDPSVHCMSCYISTSCPILSHFLLQISVRLGPTPFTTSTTLLYPSTALTSTL
jgi:hypothetical protein